MITTNIVTPTFTDAGQDSSCTVLKMNGLNFWTEFFVRLARSSRDQSLFLLAWFCQEACVGAPEALACKCPITSSFQPHPRKKDRWVLFSNPPAAYQRIRNYERKSLEKQSGFSRSWWYFQSDGSLSQKGSSLADGRQTLSFPCVDKYSPKLNQFGFFMFRNFCRLLVIIS